MLKRAPKNTIFKNFLDFFVQRTNKKSILWGGGGHMIKNQIP